MEAVSVIIFAIILLIIYYLWWKPSGSASLSTRTTDNNANSSTGIYPDLTSWKNSSIYKIFGEGSRHPEAIFDKFTSLEEVTNAIRKAGLESCSLIFGIDFTASNIHQGLKTNNGWSLHHLDMMNPNPYQRVICTLGETLEPFDDDGLIPAFGFGDITTKDFGVFPFIKEGFCTGFQTVLNAYEQIVQKVCLSGPTNFAPLIYKAIDIVRATRAYHILVIVADGQVSCETPTRNAIVEASNFPLSIILVGVGDGPWNMMEEFDNNLPSRKFDNFQFVDFYKIMTTAWNPQAAFALCALMEIPDQYKKVKQLGLLNNL